MATKAKSQNSTDVQVEAAKEIYDVARSQADIEIQKLKLELEVARQDHEAIGAIKQTDMLIEFHRLMKYLAIHNVLKRKDYKKAGMTKEQFLDAIGEPYKTTDRLLTDLAPIYEVFSDKMSSLYGMKVNEIRLLGRDKTLDLSNFDGEYLPYKDEKIHISEAPILIRRIQDDHKKEIEDRDADLKAKERNLVSKEEVIKRQEREIKRLEKTVEVSDLSPEEQEQFELLKELQRNLIALVSTVRQKIDFQKSSTTVLRQLYFLYIFGSKVLMEERMELNEVYKDAEEVPWEIIPEELPPTDVLVDNMPLTKGMGPAYKEKIQQRSKK